MKRKVFVKNENGETREIGEIEFLTDGTAITRLIPNPFLEKVNTILLQPINKMKGEK